MLIVREANYLTEKWKVTGTDIKKPTLTIDIFYVSLNKYLFVNKGKIFDSQVSCMKPLSDKDGSIKKFCSTVVYNWHKDIHKDIYLLSVKSV